MVQSQISGGRKITNADSSRGATKGSPLAGSVLAAGAMDRWGASPVAFVRGMPTMVPYDKTGNRKSGTLSQAGTMGSPY